MTKVMTLEEDYQARCRIARKEGRAEGEEAGASRITTLQRKLIADDRMDDLIRSTEDSVFQAQLLAEYGLSPDI